MLLYIVIEFLGFVTADVCHLNLRVVVGVMCGWGWSAEGGGEDYGEEGQEHGGEFCTAVYGDGFDHV